jgi:mannose-6-phosphate isomerase
MLGMAATLENLAAHLQQNRRQTRPGRRNEAVKLQAHAVEKPWGRNDLASVFGAANRQIGEIWFEHPAGKELPLLIKYIFTSEKLSVQVHPNDEEARDRGLERGKNECWYILDAAKGATLGLGLKPRVSADALRAAAIDGSIESLMDWRPVVAGDFFYVPAGTVHAIGAGIMLLEVQQNADVTYRLFDYGRPRELHLDDGIAVSKLEEYASFNVRPSSSPVDTVLVDGPYFSLIRASSTDHIPPSLAMRRRWIMPLQGRAESDGDSAIAGECLLLEPSNELALTDSAIVLIGVEGSVAG